MWAPRQSTEYDTPPTCPGGHALVCPPPLSAWNTEVRIRRWMALVTPTRLKPASAVGIAYVRMRLACAANKSSTEN